MIMGASFVTIPRDDGLYFGNVDTMCLCVRTELARKFQWSAHKGVGTDYHWLSRLLTLRPRVNFSNEVVGIHLN